MNNLQILQWTDHNGKKQTLDLNAALGQLLVRAQNRGFPGTVNANQYGQYQGLPIDIGKDRRGDYAFKGGVDFSVFDNPKLAEQALESYFEVSQSVVNKANQLFEEAKQLTGGKWNHMTAINHYTKEMGKFSSSSEFSNAKAGMESYIQALDSSKDTNTNLTNSKQTTSQATQTTQKNIPSGDPSAPYGKDPITGKVLTKTQAYNLAKTANSDMDFNAFDNNPNQYLINAGVKIKSIDPMPSRTDVTGTPGEGTVSEQNKTGMAYPVWAKIMKEKGEAKTSYKDWLKATEPPEGYTLNSGGAAVDSSGNTTNGAGGIAGAGGDDDFAEFLTYNEYLENLPDKGASIIKQWEDLAAAQIGDDYTKLKDKIDKSLGFFNEKQKLENDLTLTEKKVSERYISEDLDRFLGYSSEDRVKGMTQIDTNFAKALSSAASGYLDMGIRLGSGMLRREAAGIREDVSVQRDSLLTTTKRNEEGQLTQAERQREQLNMGYDAYKRRSEFEGKVKTEEAGDAKEELDIEEKRKKSELVSAQRQEARTVYTQNQLRAY